MRHRHSMHEPRPVYAAGPTLDFEDDGKWQEIISINSRLAEGGVRLQVQARGRTCAQTVSGGRAPCSAFATGCDLVP